MNSPLAYIGGKSKLANKIISMIPEHKAYCEVFAGAAWVFFRKPPSKYEVINDLDSDLVCFYRVVQNHLEEFLKQFKWILASREWFEDWKSQQESRGLTDIQRAARYYYLQRMCFAGRVRGRTFGTSPMNRSRINLLRLEEELSEVHLRLAGVTIEHLHWQKFIKIYDKPGTFFYLDPPYYKAPYYKHNFRLADFQELSKILGGIKADFLLSLNDHPDIWSTFNAFNIETVRLSYSASTGECTKACELLIKNR